MMSNTEPLQREFRFRAIGVIHSPFQEPTQTPIQPVFASDVRGQVEVFPEYAEGLKDLEGFSHLHLIYVFDRVGPMKLRVKPYLQDVEHGIFATRAPTRPNPIGMSIVRLLGREGAVLHVAELDILDGTPLLDIKPFSPRFDLRDNVRTGWMEQVDEATAWQRGRRAGRNPDQC
jgi:tRNA-Thr(GGU) m(6)t(6)A37 methyltransferase TsaA